MIVNLKARLAETAAVSQRTEQKNDCLVLTDAWPLSCFEGLLSVKAEDIDRIDCSVAGFDPRKALFLDAETTGLRGAGTLAFLIGAGRIEDDRFVLRQYFLRSYAEEPSMLRCLCGLVEEAETIVTFNGKSYDIPLLKDRCLMARIPPSQWKDRQHLDLLHAARRTWKLRIGSCTLDRIEEEILGMSPRETDIPGEQIPERYFSYLRNGDFSQVREILAHNSQDVRTMAGILTELCRLYRTPEVCCQEDLLSIGKALNRGGRPQHASLYLKRVQDKMFKAQAHVCLADLYRRGGDLLEAEKMYRCMIREGEKGVEPYVKLAILQEWRLKDPDAALTTTEEAIKRFSGACLSVSEADLAPLEARRRRLIQKKHRQHNSV